MAGVSVESASQLIYRLLLPQTLSIKQYYFGVEGHRYNQVQTNSQYRYWHLVQDSGAKQKERHLSKPYHAFLGNINRSLQEHQAKHSTTFCMIWVSTLKMLIAMVLLKASGKEIQVSRREGQRRPTERKRRERAQNLYPQVRWGIATLMGKEQQRKCIGNSLAVIVFNDSGMNQHFFHSLCICDHSALHPWTQPFFQINHSIFRSLIQERPQTLFVQYRSTTNTTGRLDVKTVFIVFRVGFCFHYILQGISDKILKWEEKIQTLKVDPETPKCYLFEKKSLKDFLLVKSP